MHISDKTFGYLVKFNYLYNIKLNHYGFSKFVQ